MSKISVITKIASIALMEAIIVATMFLLLILLKMIGVEGGMITRVIPFLSILTCTAIYYYFIDKGSLKWRPNNYDILGILLFTAIAFIPAVMDKAFLTNLTHTYLDYRWLGYYLLVALAEELFFRAYICYRLRELKKGYRILTSAVAFACIHFISSEEMTLFLFLLFVVFGIVFALTYENLNRILPLIGFHLVWNFMADYSENYSNMLLVLGVWILMLVASLILKNIAKPSAMINL